MISGIGSTIDRRIELFPELFPAESVHGYQMKDIYRSKKQSVWIRRIEIGGVEYTIRPSFIMPYLWGYVDKIKAALFLRKFNVPFWAMSYDFGKDPMYWYRIEQSVERNSIVGTTVRNPENIPKHLTADEKHTQIFGDKPYVATTVGDGCILGAAVAKDAGERALTNAYRVYKQEARCVKSEYTPETVNIDGWKATRNAWQTLFQAVVIICCFLHMFNKKRMDHHLYSTQYFHGSLNTAQLSIRGWALINIFSCIQSSNRKNAQWIEKPG